MPQIYLQRYPSRSCNCVLGQRGLNSMCWSYRLAFLPHVLEGGIVGLCLSNPWALGLWYYERRKIWFLKKKLGLFFGHYFGTQGEVTGFFHQPFWEVPMVYFFPDFFLFLFPKVMDSHLRYWDIYISFQDEEIWELNYCIPLY